MKAKWLAALVAPALTLGIVNLFDRAPPFSNQSAAGQVMFDPGYADPRGRTFYARIALAFK